MPKAHFVAPPGVQEHPGFYDFRVEFAKYSPYILAPGPGTFPQPQPYLSLTSAGAKSSQCFCFRQVKINRRRKQICWLVHVKKLPGSCFTSHFLSHASRLPRDATATYKFPELHHYQSTAHWPPTQMIRKHRTTCVLAQSSGSCQRSPTR
ncbi:hypothetical protein VTL71DRAFT_12139 [Oculimacula yallundae]|uniref:Uncharacterized protein n=1 Tax=Oculimacula yallundae TaxID=86028 RepID=A0ABR4CUG3_9HELO